MHIRTAPIATRIIYPFAGLSPPRTLTKFVVNDVTIRIIIDAMKVAREITSFLSISFFDMVGRIA